MGVDKWLKWENGKEWGRDKVPYAGRRICNDILSGRSTLLLYLHSAVCM